MPQKRKKHTRPNDSPALCSRTRVSGRRILRPSAKASNGKDEGDGPLRAALASGATRIVINPSVTTITVTKAFEYAGTATVSINGNGRTIDGVGLADHLAPILAVSGSVDLVEL